MPELIQPLKKAGWKARRDKINEIIARVNALANLQIETSQDIHTSKVEHADDRTVLQIQDLTPELNKIKRALDL